MVPEKRVKTCCYKVCHMVAEKCVKKVPYTVCKPVHTTKTIQVTRCCPKRVAYTVTGTCLQTTFGQHRVTV